MFSNKLEFKGAVIGMLLGDASIPKVQRGINAAFKCTHSLKQKEYLLYKKNILEWLTECRVCEYETKVKGKSYPIITLDSRVHPFYTALREHLYFQGRKTIDEHVMKCLTPMGLALWYQDDGCLINHENFLTPFLCTHGFNKVEVELMARSLLKKFGLQWRLRKDKQYYALRLRRKDRENFFELIKPFIDESMMYKIRDDGKRAINNNPIFFDCLSCGEKTEVAYKFRYRKYCSAECYHNSRREQREESAV